MNYRKTEVRDPLPDNPTRAEIAILMLLAIVTTGVIILMESWINV